MSEVEQVMEVKNLAGEGPIWNHDEKALYLVDVPNHNICRYYPANNRYETFDIGLPVSAMGFRASGGLIIATRDGLAFWDFYSRTPDFVADHAILKTNAPFNDGAVDRQGRFWAGTWGGGEHSEPNNKLYRLDTDGLIHIMEKGITISNGIGWSPDSKTMYYTDSPPHVIYAYDFDPITGNIENRRIFVTTPENEGEPDGLAIDSEGFVWSARWDGWKISRFDPNGKLEREIQLPVQRPTSCAFGGRELDELYITSALLGLSENQKKTQPYAGNLLRIRTNVKGLVEPKFLG